MPTLTPVIATYLNEVALRADGSCTVMLSTEVLEVFPTAIAIVLVLPGAETSVEGVNVLPTVAARV